MSFQLKVNESVEKGVKRIAHEQLDKAINELTDDQLDKHETVHQVRKRCKKLRGLLRLVRINLDDDDYQKENAWYRDAARGLSYVRDAQTLVDTYDDIIERFEDQLQQEAFQSIRQELIDRRKRITEDEVGLQEKLEEFLAKMRKAKTRVDDWKIKGDGFDALASGLEKTYGRACKAMKTAYENGTTDSFHEWRKRAKYHWYHARLLQRIWLSMMKVHRNSVKTLSDYLGDDHDFAVLRQTIIKEPEAYGSEKDIQAFVALVDRRRHQLQTQAQPLGQRLFCESAQAHSDRLRSYWDAWYKEDSLDSF